MPRTTFDSANTTPNIFDYPKLFLEKGERARVLVIEDPLYEYVHTLRAPRIVNGRVITETVTNRTGGTTEQPAYDFVSRPICIGDYGINKEKGKDPDGCPVCAASSETDAVRAPERRWAMHVIRYQTKPGAFEVAEPFSVQLLGWAFNDKVYTQIAGFADEFDSEKKGDALKKHDLLLGPCEVKQYQRFDISVAGKAEWLASKERKALVAQTYKENQSPDLTFMIGRRLGREAIEEDLAKVRRAHRIAFSQVEPEAEPTETEKELDLDQLLDEKPAEKDEATNEAAEPAVSLDFDDLLGE